MMSLDDQIRETRLDAYERDHVVRKLLLRSDFGATVGELAVANEVKPMRIAQELVELRPNDSTLRDLVRTSETLILKYGTSHLSPEAVAESLKPSDKFWRNHDPLGVYRPGDMFYVDHNDKMARYYPVLILVPTAAAILIPLLIWLFRR
jgi:hypothetical protein